MVNKNISKKIIHLLSKHNPKKIGIFGSFARNQQSTSSDIDILVDFKEQKSLLELIEIEMELADALDRKIDLVTEASVHPYLQNYIQRDLQIIYQQ
jgi:predicted nucleotidyltransferase